MNRTDSKIQWLSVLQGWAMLLVVIGHANFYEFMHGGSGSDTDWLHRFAYAFHMPLFMFVSGGLFYLTRLARSWTYRDVVVDKFKRLVVPYMAGTLFAFVLKASLSQYMKRGIDWSVHGFVYSFLVPAEGPIGEMWFVATLFLLMMLFPLYRLAMRHPLAEAALLFVMAVLLFTGLPLPTDWPNMFNVRDVPEYGFYFFAGMLCFRYRWLERIGCWWIGAALAAVFAVSYALWARVTLLTPMIGILMSVSLCMVVSRLWPQLFGSFRDFTFQIFLIGLYPQMLIELFVWNRLPHNWITLIVCYVVSVSLALYVPVVLARLANRYCPRWLRMCLGLK